AALGGRWLDVSSMLGGSDAAVVTSPEDEIVFALHPEKKLVPASTLKILTALVSFHHLGPEFRFKTEFYLDPDKNLVIKGYGDPLLVSEEVEKIAQNLAGKTDEISGIVVDDSAFAEIDIPGTSAGSHKPYNAPIGALCVNFNTVNLKKTQTGYVSAEPQTPLLPSVLKRIRGRGVSGERILLSSRNSENLVYAGELFAYFLAENGVRISGPVRPGLADTQKDRLIHTHRSGFALTETVALLMEHSNNFIANQLLAAAGAQACGPPATLEKGLLAARSFAREKLGISPQIVEGSGISRQNLMSAEMFVPLLEAFRPYYALLPEENGIYFKTGTLDGIRNRAGYIEVDGKFYGFAVLINTPDKSAEPVVRKIASVLRQAD
ncbi:MAG: D-alanyl-D-alanine carboxypeptidase/D-alanyl-D-alanine-endopeptidase, partial [Desulfosalsimonas sp.]